MFLCFRDENQIIQNYFWEGFRYKTIMLFLSEYHGIDISFSTLRRRLQDMGLERRGQSSPMMTVWNIIRMEMRGPG